MKTIKNWLIVALSILMMVCCAMGLITVGVKADASPTKKVLEDIDLTLDNTQVRMPLEDDGEGGLKPTDNKEKNGIRFVIKLSKDEFDALPKGYNIIFGALVLPKDYNDALAVSEENVFGDNPHYVFSKEEAVDGKKQIIRVETNKLALNPNNTPDDTSDDFYYYNVSMIDLNEGNIDREFMAIPYVKTRIGGAIDAEFAYDLKLKDSKADSMAYLAQKKIEDKTVDSSIRDALQTNYINGLTAKISISMARKYNDTTIAYSHTFELDLGTVITKELCDQLMATTIDTFTKNTYNLSNYSIRDYIIRNEDKQKVDSLVLYANQRGIYVEPNSGSSYIGANWTPINISDEQSYAEIADYYTSNEKNSVILGADKKFVMNADFAGEGAPAVGTYSLYADGVISATADGKKYFGYQTDSGLKLSDVASSNPSWDTRYDYAEATSYELPQETYDKVAGMYKIAGTKESIQLNADGTLTSNLATDGSYVIAYDTNTDSFNINVTILGGNTFSSSLSYSKDTGFTFEEGTNIYTAGKKIASQTKYNAIANTYNGQMHVIGDATGNLKSGSTTEYEGAYATPWKDYIKLNADGTLEFNGSEQIGYTWYNNYPREGHGYIRDVKYGRYVLYDDNTIDLFIPYFASPTSTTTKHVITDYAIMPAIFDPTTKSVTVDFSEYRYTQGNYAWDLSVTFTTDANVASFDDAFMANLLKDFTNDRNSAGTAQDPLNPEVTTTNSWYYDDTFHYGDNTGLGWSRLEFYGTGTFVYYHGHTLFGNFEMHPITKKFGYITTSITAYGGNNTAAAITHRYDDNPFNIFNDLYYYDLGNGCFQLYADYIDENPNYRWGGGSGYNFFDEILPWTSKNSTVKVAEHFELLAGGVGAVEEPSIKSYYGFGVSLQLENDGILKVESSILDRQNKAYNKATAGKAVINFGSGNVNATYNLVPIEFTKGQENGLFFMHLSQTPAHKTVDNANEFIEGTYEKSGNEIIISFNYNGVNYKLSDNAQNASTAKDLVGTYIGNGEIIVLNDDNTANVGGVDATYSLDGNAITISGEGVDLKGSVVENGSSFKLSFGKYVYVQQELSLDELFVKYAGTYYTTYTASIELAVVNAYMKLVLNTDGTLVATGGGTYTNGRDAGEEATDRDVIAYDQAKYGPYIIDMGHLGETENTGRYTFELVNGEVRIVLMFDVCTDKDGNPRYLDRDAGYSSIIKYSNQPKANDYYNVEVNGVTYEGYVNYVYYGGTGIRGFANACIRYINAYCVGTINNDGSLDIVFQAFSNDAIHFTQNKPADYPVEQPAE